MRRLIDDRSSIEAKTGLDLVVQKVAVRDLARQRPFTVADGVLGDQPLDLVDAIDLTR